MAFSPRSSGPSPLMEPPRSNPQKPPQARSRISYTNAAYYPNWKIYKGKPPSSLSLAYISHIIYAFAWPASDNTIVLSDEPADLEMEVDGTQGGINALTQLKREHPRLKFILSVGGADGSTYFPQIASNNTSRMIFASSARSLVDMYGFDGIDIDWEYPNNPSHGANYIALLAATRAALPRPHYILTSALPANTWALQNINLSLASSYLEYLSLMAYDFYGPWTPCSGHQSQLYSPSTNPSSVSGHAAVTHCLERFVTPSKILLGIPTFARAFPGTNGPGQVPIPNTGNTDDRVIEYADLPLVDTFERFDAELGVAYLVDDKAGFVSYDNVDTVRMKATYVQQMRLGGLFYWAGTGDVSGSRSLVEAGYNTLHAL